MKISEREFQFTYSRSSGAGGQNVNKVNTKVTMSWAIECSPSISVDVKRRFKAKFKRFITFEGVVKIESQRYRSQARNTSDCVAKLHKMIADVATTPKKRLKTRPTKGSIEKRINKKKLNSLIKKNRKKVRY